MNKINKGFKDFTRKVKKTATEMAAAAKNVADSREGKKILNTTATVFIVIGTSILLLTSIVSGSDN